MRSTAAAESSVSALATKAMISALTMGGRDLALMRLVARVGIDPPQRWDRFSASFDQIRAASLRVLRANLPETKDQELIFRTRCAAGLLNWVVLAPVGAELGHKSQRQISRMLIPVIAGAFRGTG